MMVHGAWTCAVWRWLGGGSVSTVAPRCLQVEVTTNDPDSRVSAGVDTFAPYYQVLAQASGPLVAVFKDVDSAAGRGASFGDGMARQHRSHGVVVR